LGGQDSLAKAIQMRAGKAVNAEKRLAEAQQTSRSPGIARPGKAGDGKDERGSYTVWRSRCDSEIRAGGYNGLLSDKKRTNIWKARARWLSLSVNMISG
jgi:hypothetical protein